MDKKESFKIFAKNHPELVNSIKNGDTSWQKLYEIYDIYGEDTQAWNPYFNKEINLSNITNFVKKIDMDSVQKHINTAQKALGLVEELTTKNTTSLVSKIPTSTRPINHFFED